MPDVTISIGQKDFTVACQEGEEGYLQTAADMLDREATALLEQIGRIPDSRMLLMAGLMLADRTAALEERAEAAEAKLSQQDALVADLQGRGATTATGAAEALSPAQEARLTQLAEAAEALAALAESRA